MSRRVAHLATLAAVAIGWLAHVGAAATGPDHGPRNLMLGTSTGGGKFPFLVVVYWDGPDGVDPRDSTSVWCHGVMVSSDVVLTTWGCRPARFAPQYNGPYVMVGDSPFPDTSSIQFREWDNETWVQHSGMDHNLFKIQPVTFPGFSPVELNLDPYGVWKGQRLTVVGYGTNSSDYNKTVRAEKWSWPGQALEATLEVASLSAHHARAEAPGLGPCRGDVGVPFLDQSKCLVGIGTHPFCGATNEDHFNVARVSHIADWLIHNVCALSEDREALALCPDLVCPADRKLMGYPWAELPDGTGLVKGLRGFSPVAVRQFPPPGTLLWRDTTRVVTLLATDSLNRSLGCLWTVTVPPLIELGNISFDIPPGNSNASGDFRLTHRSALTGSIYKMRGQLRDSLSGSGSSVSARLRSDKYGLRLKIVESRANASLRYMQSQRVPVRFDASGRSVVRLDVATQQNAERNNATFKVFGQVHDAYF